MGSCDAQTGDAATTLGGGLVTGHISAFLMARDIFKCTYASRACLWSRATLTQTGRKLCIPHVYTNAGVKALPSFRWVRGRLVEAGEVYAETRESAVEILNSVHIPALQHLSVQGEAVQLTEVFYYVVGMARMDCWRLESLAILGVPLADAADDEECVATQMYNAMRKCLLELMHPCRSVLHSLKLRLVHEIDERSLSVFMEAFHRSTCLERVELLGLSTPTAQLARALKSRGWTAPGPRKRGVWSRPPHRASATDGPGCVALNEGFAYRACGQSLRNAWHRGEFRAGPPPSLAGMKAGYLKEGVRICNSAQTASFEQFVYEPEPASSAWIEVALVQVDFGILLALKQLPEHAYVLMEKIAGQRKFYFFLNVNRKANAANVYLGAFQMAVVETDSGCNARADRCQAYYWHLCGAGRHPQVCDGSCGNKTGDQRHCDGAWWPYQSLRLTYLALSDAL